MRTRTRLSVISMFVGRFHRFDIEIGYTNLPFNQCSKDLPTASGAGKLKLPRFAKNSPRKGRRIAPKTIGPLRISWAALLDTIDPDGDYNVFPFLDGGLV